MGRPASGLDEYLDWQERLESYRASGLSVDEFCLSEGIAKSSFGTKPLVARTGSSWAAKLRDRGWPCYTRSWRVRNAIASSRGVTCENYSFGYMRMIHDWTRCRPTAGPPRIPRPSSTIGSTNPEPKPPASEPAVLIAVPTPSNAGLASVRPRTGRTLTDFLRSLNAAQERNRSPRQFNRA